MKKLVFALLLVPSAAQAQDVARWNWGDDRSIPVISTAAYPIQMIKSREGKCFASYTGLVTTAGTTEVPFFLFVNVTTNTVSAYLDKFRYGTGSGAVVAAFKVYRNSVITSSGTALSIFNCNTGSSNTSKMMTFVSPTTSSFGQQVAIYAQESGARDSDLHFSRIIVPARSFLVTLQNNLPGTVNFAGVEWFEE